MPLLLVSPWFWGAVASATTGVLGWVTGFFGSESIKNLAWFALIVAALIAVYFIRQMG